MSFDQPWREGTLRQRTTATRPAAARRRIGLIAIGALFVGAILGAGLALAAVAILDSRDPAEQSPQASPPLVLLQSDVAFAPPTEDPTEEPAGPTSAPLPTVAVIAPGRAQDRSFTQSMADATVDLVESDELTEVFLAENVSPRDAEARLRELAADFDLVIAHSSTYRAAVLAVAADFPAVVFAVAGASEPTPWSNVYTYTVAAEQGGYLLGVISARSSPTGVIGVIGSVDVGTSGNFVDGFHNGAHSERTDTRVLISYTGLTADPEAATAAVIAHIDDGADVIAGHGQRFDEAILLADQRQVAWLSNETGPVEGTTKNVVAAQVYDWRVVLRPIMADLQTDAVEGRHLVADLSNGGVFIAFHPEIPTPSATTDRVDELAAEIMAGSLDPLASP